MSGRLPDEVRWRRGKENLGSAFTRRLMEASEPGMKLAITESGDLLSDFIDSGPLGVAGSSFLDGADLAMEVKLHHVVSLALWVNRYRDRPKR